MTRVPVERAARMTGALEDRLLAALDGGVGRRAVLGGLGTAGAAALGASRAGRAAGGPTADTGAESTHGQFAAVGEDEGDGFDPHGFLREFDTGEVVGTDEAGRRIRAFEFTAVDRFGESGLEIAPGVRFPAWTYNGQVPGPTIRAVEGDRIRVRFTNGSAHAHTIHPHLRNLAPAMDGIPQNGPGVLDTGESFTYEWIAQPAGLHLYHCHSLPLKEHIHRGLYGAVVVDPDPERVRARPADYVNQHPSQVTPELADDLVAEARTRNHEYPENDAVDELVIVMNSFDTNFDGDNEVYAANTRAFAY
ncbi:MAG: multicopper oxidase domain-containing protein, partial [Halobacteriales archaeon]